MKVKMMNGYELKEFMEVFKLDTKNSSILNPSIVTYSNGDIYKGELDIIKGNLRHGYGEMIYKNGDIHATKWKNDVAQGAGIYISKNGVEIRGNWKNGQLNDKTISTIKYPDGDVYNGQIHNNTMNGYGLFTYSDGEIYNGQYLNGVRTGYGVSYFINGCVYEGYWENDTLNGHGILYTHEKIYTGFWNNGVQDNSGEILLVTC